MTQKRSKKFPDVTWKASVRETSFWNLMRKAIDEVSQLSLWIKNELAFDLRKMLRKSRGFCFVKIKLRESSLWVSIDTKTLPCFASMILGRIWEIKGLSINLRLRQWGMRKLHKWDLAGGYKEMFYLLAVVKWKETNFSKCCILKYFYRFLLNNTQKTLSYTCLIHLLWV